MALWFSGTRFAKATTAAEIQAVRGPRWDSQDARSADDHQVGRWGAQRRSVTRADARRYRSAKLEHELTYGDYLHD